MPLTHKNLASSLANIAATYDLGPADRSLLVMPLFHVHGLMAGAHVFQSAAGNEARARAQDRTIVWAIARGMESRPAAVTACPLAYCNVL